MNYPQTMTCFMKKQEKNLSFILAINLIFSLFWLSIKVSQSLSGKSEALLRKTGSFDSNMFSVVTEKNKRQQICENKSVKGF